MALITRGMLNGPGRVRTEESNSYVHDVSGLGLGKNMKWHFWPIEFQTTSPAGAILHSSAVGGYKMCSP